MGAELLLVGRLRPELGVRGTSEGLPAVDVRHPEAIQSAVAELGSEGRPVLLVCEEREAPAVRYQRALLYAALPHVTTVLEPVPGPPLAVSVVGALVNDMRDRHDAAIQLAAMDRLRERLWCALWLDTVAKLADPAPRVTQHLRSWFPSDGFLALFTENRVLTAKRGQVLAEVEEPPTGGKLIVSSTQAPEWLVPEVAAGVDADHRTDMSSWRDPRDAYGASAAAELVLVPQGADEVGAAQAQAFVECAGCGHRNPRSVCAFCTMSVQRADPPADDPQDLSPARTSRHLGAAS